MPGTKTKHASSLSTRATQEEEPLLAPPPPGAPRCLRGSPRRRRSCCLARDACEGERKGSGPREVKNVFQVRARFRWIDGQVRKHSGEES